MLPPFVWPQDDSSHQGAPRLPLLQEDGEYRIDQMGVDGGPAVTTLRAHLQSLQAWLAAVPADALFFIGVSYGVVLSTELPPSFSPVCMCPASAWADAPGVLDAVAEKIQAWFLLAGPLQPDGQLQLCMTFYGYDQLPRVIFTDLRLPLTSVSPALATAS